MPDDQDPLLLPAQLQVGEEAADAGDGLPPASPARVGPVQVLAPACVQLGRWHPVALAISDYTYVLGGGQVLMADTPARLAANREFTESFFGVAPTIPQSPKG
jgi:hypothetical protein